MENSWGVLLMLGVAIASTTEPPPQQMLSYEEAVSLAIDLYNQGSDVDFAFRLLEADPQPDWAMTNEPLPPLAFTVKETECPVSENLALEECDYRVNGVVRKCSGSLFTEQAAPLLLITCNTVAQEHPRVRRSGSKQLKRKIVKKLIKKGIQDLLGGVGQGRLQAGDGVDRERPGLDLHQS